MRVRLRAALTWTFAVACSAQGPARPEVVVVLDTDAPLVGELALHPELSPDSAVDTLRIDVLDDADDIVDLRSFLVADLESWPVSFGVVPPPTGDVRLRIRLFRALFATAGTAAGMAVLDPPPQTTIERLVRVAAPSGVLRVGVLLTEDCLGTASSFLAPETTCIDASELGGPPTDGVTPVSGDPAPTVAGTWAPAREVPCASSPKAGTRCIPGGFSILGEEVIAGSSLVGFDPVPLRPAVVSPFLLDTDEYTVGRFRALLQRGPFKGPLPQLGIPSDPDLKYCTWLGATAPANDHFALNCVYWQTAMLACQAEGGTLPSEAQWEHAARGRGQRRLYPWGNEDATCCAASVSRTGPPPYDGLCAGFGMQTVGSHPATAACGGLGDVSRDGVLDMLGSLTEAMADSLDQYDAPCWSSAGILTDPICRDPASPYAARGSNWNSDPDVTLPTRLPWQPDGRYVTGGFRCVYPSAGGTSP